MAFSGKGGLFRKVKARTRRECGIVLRRFLLLKINNTSAAFAVFVQQRMRQHLLDSNCFTPLKSFHADRIKVVRCLRCPGPKQKRWLIGF